MCVFCPGNLISENQRMIISYGGGGDLLAKFSPALVIPWTITRYAPLSTGFSWQEYWSGLPCPPPGDLPSPGMEPMTPVQADSLPLSHRVSPWMGVMLCQMLILHLLKLSYEFLFLLWTWWITYIHFQELNQPYIPQINLFSNSVTLFMYFWQ